jgi:phage shock protein A
MTQEEAKAHMDKLLNEATARAADRNVSALRVANRGLRGRIDEIEHERQQPGSREDGGMAPAGSGQMSVVDMVRNALDDAHRIVGNFEKSTIELESKVAELEAKLDAERAARSSLEKMLQQIVDLVNPR